MNNENNSKHYVNKIDYFLNKYKNHMIIIGKIINVKDCFIEVSLLTNNIHKETVSVVETFVVNGETKQFIKPSNKYYLFAIDSSNAVLRMMKLTE